MSMMNWYLVAVGMLVLAGLVAACIIEYRIETANMLADADERDAKAAQRRALVLEASIATLDRMQEQRKQLYPEHPIPDEMLKVVRAANVRAAEEDIRRREDVSARRWVRLTRVPAPEHYPLSGYRTSDLYDLIMVTEEKGEKCIELRNVEGLPIIYHIEEMRDEMRRRRAVLKEAPV